MYSMLNTLSIFIINEKKLFLMLSHLTAIKLYSIKYLPNSNSVTIVCTINV